MTTTPAPAAAGEQGSTSGRWRLARSLLHSTRWTVGSLLRFLITWVMGTVVLAIIIRILPGITADDWWDIAFAVVLVAAVTIVLRPILGALAVATSWFGIVVIGFFAQAVIVYVGLILSPGIHIDGFGTALVASWLYAIMGALGAWLMLVDDDSALLAHVVRSAQPSRFARRRARRKGITLPVPGADGLDGVVFVQLDGVPWPLLQVGVASGDIPTISRWVRSGTHVMREWTAAIPCTTPVSQAGILHGNNDGMPAFRWYEKDSGRLLVANRPADAAEIESRVSDRHGLLADDGCSISNLFSGDAEINMLSMAGMSEGRRGLGPSRSYASFVLHPFGFTRAFFLTIGEMVKELHQGWQQERRGIEPRIHRHGSYVLLRAATNVMLRDLNMALVAEQMVLGRRAIYVDFVDYDEIAHHAGPLRSESIASLVGLDQVVESLERVAEQVNRRYHFVLLSDHGQSQGPTFLQKYGQSLEDVVSELADSQDTVAVTSSIEGWGPVNAFLTDLTGQSGMAASIARRSLAGRSQDGGVGLGPGDREAAAAQGEGADATSQRPELVVVGSGNLGLVWFAREPGRLTLEQLEELHPGLVGALANHPGVGWVLVQTASHGPVVVGANGLHRLVDGTIEGEDPLAPFVATAAPDLLRLAGFGNAADLFVGSAFEPMTDEVSAFEELVGCHGGLGGWQTSAMLVHPAEWPMTEAEHLHGAPALHRQLVRWLADLGHRTDLPERSPAGSDVV
ncbi:phage holin family protein [Angustibacter sp. McL0619]|uniref:phage holin family protein n=1 Tax=Angustibacter sp. McL0619 TaxID=3415676 RepID=UPI003CF3B252